MDILGVMNIGRLIICLNVFNVMVMVIDMRMVFRYAMVTMFELM